MRTSLADRVAVVASIISLLLLAGVSTVLIAPEEVGRSGPPDTTYVSAALYSLTMEVLSEGNGRTAGELEDILTDGISSAVLSGAVQVEGYKSRISSSDVVVRKDLFPISGLYPPETMTTDQGHLVPNSVLRGRSGGLPILPSVHADVSVSLELEALDGGANSLSTIRFQAISVDPEMVLSSLLSMMGNDMEGWGSGLSRDMEYMLNSLVRMRTVRLGIGTGAFDTNLDILNEGDIELCYNIALALSIARWTGKVPEDLVSEIDRFYSRAVIAPTMNPTGERIWGEAERGSFLNYVARTKAAGGARQIKDLIGNALSIGHSDTSDLFLLYLHMDQRTSRNERLDPLDGIGPLEEIGLLNSRQRKDTVDPYSLEHHPSFPAEGGLPIPDLVDRSDGVEETVPVMVPEIGPSTGYSVLGKDLRVSGLNEYVAWFTNADPDALTEEDLINYGNMMNSYTRCGAILPPPEPPYHDYRIQWDLRIDARLVLEGTMGGVVGNSAPDSTVTHELNLSFPIRVHSWFLDEPNEDGGIRLFNINTGEQVYTPISTAWVITPKANATEYFEKYTFQDIREGLSIGSSLLRSVSYRMGLLDQASARRSVQVNALAAIPAMRLWMAQGGIGKDLALLYHVYLKGKGLKPESIGTIRTDGLAMSLAYSQTKDRMDITSTMPEGNVVLSVMPISSQAPQALLRVTTGSELEISIDPARGTFEVTGRLEGEFFKEGSMTPEQPSKAISDLMLQDISILASSGSVLPSTDHASPYDPASTIHTIGPDVPVLNMLLIGPEDVLDEVGQELGELDPSVQEAAAQPAQYLSHLLGLASERGLWAGACVTWKGENGSAPFTRTILIKGHNGTDLPHIRSVLSQLVLAAHPDLLASLRNAAEGALEIVLIERVPSWVVPPGTIEGQVDVIFAAHFRFEQALKGEVMTLSAFHQDPSGATVLGSSILDWSVVKQRSALPLW